MLTMLMCVIACPTLVWPSAQRWWSAWTLERQRTEELVTILTQVRNALERYRIEHNAYPGFIVNGTTLNGDDVDGGTRAAEFANQLTRCSNAVGETTMPSTDMGKATCAEGFKYARYLKRIPPNPFTGSAGVVVVHAYGQISADDDPHPHSGWKFNTATGQFIANLEGYDEY